MSLARMKSKIIKEIEEFGPTGYYDLARRENRFGKLSATSMKYNQRLVAAFSELEDEGVIMWIAPDLFELKENLS